MKREKQGARAKAISRLRGRSLKQRRFQPDPDLPIQFSGLKCSGAAKARHAALGFGPEGILAAAAEFADHDQRQSVKKQTRVFILGAGCSAKTGYPLGSDLTHQLQEFYWSIPIDCARIKQSASDTIALVKSLPTLKTLDQLAKRIDDEFLEWSAERGSRTVDQIYLDRERLADKQIRDAKVAISVMFVCREDDARRTGLASYKRLLDSVFGGEPWEVAVAESDCHVLSFNYDRLFEVAFHDYFKGFKPQQFGTYAKEVLNSGFSNRMNGGYDKIEPAPGHFCFLKLHGSADWWVRKAAGTRGQDECRLYWPTEPVLSASAHNDHNYFRRIEDLLNRNSTLPWEALIAFSHEKQRAIKRATDFLADRYLERIEAHAASVLATPTEVRVIGYSFAPIDSRHLVNNLLSKVQESARITVQNIAVATVQSRLEAYPRLRGRVEFDPTPF